jgi:hypothetical protein
MGVYQVCSNKSPWVKIGSALGAYIQVRDFRAIVALFFFVSNAILIQFCNASPFPMDKLLTLGK